MTSSRSASTHLSIDINKPLNAVEEQVLIALCLQTRRDVLLWSKYKVAADRKKKERQLVQPNSSSEILERDETNDSDSEKYTIYNVPFNGKTYTVQLENNLVIGHSLSRGKNALRIYTLNEKLGQGGICSVYRSSSTHRIRYDEKGTPYLSANKKQRVIKIPHCVSRAEIETVYSQARLSNHVKEALTYKVMHDQKIQTSKLAIMAMAKGTDLYALKDSVKQLSLREKIQISIKVLKQLKLFHDQGIIHRDLKPENIMVYKSENGEYEVKIIDEGFKSYYGYGNNNMCGTPSYMMPEVDLENTRNYLSDRTDVGSMGIVLANDLWNFKYPDEINWYTIKNKFLSLKHKVHYYEKIKLETMEERIKYKSYKHKLMTQSLTYSRTFKNACLIGTDVSLLKNSNTSLEYDAAGIVESMLRLRTENPDAKYVADMQGRPVRFSVDQALEGFELLEAQYIYGSVSGGGQYQLEDQLQISFDLALKCRRTYHELLKQQHENLAPEHLSNFFMEAISAIPDSVDARRIFIHYLDVKAFMTDNAKVFASHRNLKHYLTKQINSIAEHYTQSRKLLIDLKHDIDNAKVDGDFKQDHLEDIDNALLKEHRATLNDRPQFHSPAYQFIQIVKSNASSNIHEAVLADYLDLQKRSASHNRKRVNFYYHMDSTSPNTVTIYWPEHLTVRQKSITLDPALHAEIIEQLHEPELSPPLQKWLRGICAHDALSLDAMADLAKQFQIHHHEVRKRFVAPPRPLRYPIRIAALSSTAYNITNAVGIAGFLSATGMTCALGLNAFSTLGILGTTITLGSIAVPIVGIALGVAGLAVSGASLVLLSRMNKIQEAHETLNQVSFNADANNAANVTYTPDLSTFNLKNAKVNRFQLLNGALASNGLISTAFMTIGAISLTVTLASPIGWALLVAGGMMAAGTGVIAYSLHKHKKLQACYIEEGINSLEENKQQTNSLITENKRKLLKMHDQPAFVPTAITMKPTLKPNFMGSCFAASNLSPTVTQQMSNAMDELDEIMDAKIKVKKSKNTTRTLPDIESKHLDESKEESSAKDLVKISNANIWRKPYKSANNPTEKTGLLTSVFPSYQQ